MTDPTESTRRRMAAKINQDPFTREHLEDVFGPDNVFDTEQLREHFDVQGFAAPFCIVQRKSDGAVGTLTFQHDPRLYWDFKEDEE